MIPSEEPNSRNCHIVSSTDFQLNHFIYYTGIHLLITDRRNPVHNGLFSIWQRAWTLVRGPVNIKAGITSIFAKVDLQLVFARKMARGAGVVITCVTHIHNVGAIKEDLDTVIVIRVKDVVPTWKVNSPPKPC